VTPHIRSKIRDRIAEADLICYPPGSFFSSVVANLLPSGVGRAVAANACPKVFVPSTGLDPEARDLSVAARAGLLRRHLAGSGAPTGSDVLSHVLVDTRNGEYPGGVNKKGLKDQGLDVVDCPLVTAHSAPNIDEKLLSKVLLSLT
ncbi:MAG: YvcK family protein, partial [Proteobacteria bacterium]|nr:YvcK family protein [Pseudomonadota bacterium]